VTEFYQTIESHASKTNVIPFPVHKVRRPRRRRRTRSEMRRRPYGRQRVLYITPALDASGGWNCREVDSGGGSRLADNVPWREALRAAAAYMRETLHPYGYKPPIKITIGEDDDCDAGGEVPGPAA
jgi:hypothetical protein